MKVFNIIFSGKQPFQAQQLVFAEDEVKAREGATVLLAEKVDGFTIDEVQDITAGDEGDVTIN